MPLFKLRAKGRNNHSISGSIYYCQEKRSKEIHLPDTLESIGEWAFRDCAGLERLVIPKSVKEIGAESFLGCSNLTIIAEKGSYAGEYAEKHGFNRQILG